VKQTNFFNWKTVLITTALVLGGLYSLQVLQAPDRILQDVFVFEEGNRVVLQVKFNLPVRYENHFPEKRGDFLQIKIRPIALTGIDKNEFIDKDAILPGFIELVPISAIAYEGDVPGGPFLSLRFSEPVNFTVAEDSSMRSIIIHVPKRHSAG